VWGPVAPAVSSPRGIWLASRLLSITFAIPFFSGLPYLREALDSVTAQESPEWRAIVVDDAGPEPEAAAMVASYGDPRISYVRNEQNLGLAGNWNRGLDLATTDLVTLLHADDRLMPCYAGALIEAHEAHPRAVAAHCRASIVDGSGRPIFSLPDEVKRVVRSRQPLLRGESGLRSLLRGNFIICPSLCFKRSVLGGRRFDGRWRMVLDLDLLARLLLDGDEIVQVERTCFEYRRHGSQMTAALTASADRFEEEIGLYEELAVAAAEQGWKRATRTASTRRIVSLHLAYRILGDALRGQGSAMRKKLALLLRR
jgi:glycosyltransferase involved in cell wall biosynthesis